MVTLVENLSSVIGLLGTASFLILVALITSSFTFSKLKGSRNSVIAKVVIGVVLGVLAIFGTLWGMKLEDGTIINVRELAAMIAGAAGGPVGGVLAGLIGGIHRFTVGGATALPCAISTIAIGLVTGLLASRISGKWYLLKGAALAFALESAAMGLVLVLVPFSQSVAIVETVYFSMIGANTIGFILWLYFSKKLKT